MRFLICFLFFIYIFPAFLSAQEVDSEAVSQQKFWSYIKHGDYVHALETGKDYLISFPESIYKDKIFFTIGELFVRLNDFENAISYFEQEKKYIEIQNKFLQEEGLVPLNIDNLIQTMEALKFPEIRYLENSRSPLSALIQNFNNPQARYLLNLLSVDSQSINQQLISLVQLRKYQDELLKAKIKQLELSNKIKYTILYYQTVKDKYSHILEQLDNLNYDGIEARLNQSETGNVFNYAQKEEIDIFKQLGGILEKTGKLVDYLNRLKESFSAERGNPQEVISILQNLQLSSPLLYQEKQEDNKNEKLAEEAKLIFSRICRMNQEIDTLLWTFTNNSLARIIPEDDHPWQKEYRNIKEVINKVINELDKSESEFTKIKKRLIDQIQNDIKGRKEIFLIELKLNQELKTKIIQKINIYQSFIEYQINDFLPLQKKSEEVLKKEKILENDFKNLLKQAENDLKTSIEKKILARIKESEQLRDESDLKIADSLFLLITEK